MICIIGTEARQSTRPSLDRPARLRIQDRASPYCPPRLPERPSAGDLDEVSRAEDALLERHRGSFEAKARELLDGRDVVTETNRGSVRARLTQYRNGAVFENWRTAPDHEGNGIARIEPSETNLVPLLVDHLANAVLDLGTDAEPR